MAKILIIDDNASNRKALVALLEHEGHETIEAQDGADGLAAVREQRPHVVMSDILMPTMDGYEFVRQLRADPEAGKTPVIFHTAHYHEREARHLAKTCHVEQVLPKPSSASDIRAAITQALIGHPATPHPVSPEFQRDHLRLVTNKLSDSITELKAANARLEALTELNVQLASERDPRLLLEKVCQGARDLLGSSFAVLTVTNPAHPEEILFATCGIDPGPGALERPALAEGSLGTVYKERRALRALNPDGSIAALGLPDSYPRARAVLAAPLCSLTRSYGWICLGDKIGAAGFDAKEEQILLTLAAQVGRIYENSSLHREVQESESRFRQIAENIQDIFFLADSDYSRMFYLSPAYERIWGRPVAGAYMNLLSWTAAIHPEDIERIRTEIKWDARGSRNGRFEFRIVRPDGAIRWILARTFFIRATASTQARVAGICTDITERKDAERSIQQLNRVYAVLSGINSLIVRVQDRCQLLKDSCRLAVEKGHFRFAWCAWMEPGATQFRRVAWAGDSEEFAARLRNPATAGATPPTLVQAALTSQQPAVCESIATDPLVEAYRPEITQRGYQSIAALPLVVNGKSVGCLVLAAMEHGFFNDSELRLLIELAGDISFALDHIEKAERLNYLAYYDELTGIANRTFFHERLSIHVQSAARTGRKLALVVAQIERFESVSDTLGRTAADPLIRELAAGFTQCVGDPDAVARLGPDMFAAVIPDICDDAQVVHSIEGWWQQWLGRAFQVNGSELRLAANAGVALFPVDGDNADTLLRHAEAALKKAKATGDRHLFYTQHLADRSSEKLALESRLRRALENEEFLLHYQPKVDLETRRVTGVEALLRWQNPQMGLVQPSQFIPLMEETGIIVDVGAWALRQACLDRSRWLELGFKAPRVAVNVSTVQLRRNDFVRMVKNTLRTAGNEPGIDIEVTESLIMQDAADNIAKLVAVRDLGVKIAIDDFGTGYSSLGYLTKLPVQVLKIDRAFVASMLDDPSAMTLVSTIISLAHALRLEVVAEGVESEEQAKILRLVRCDQMQGFLVSRPVPFDDMTTFLGRHRS
jgi:diguanylate cyclase (GGDEF)-like protein/PAS domain S-box-containing protein